MKKQPLPIDPSAINLQELVDTKEAAQLLHCNPVTLALNRAKPNPIPFIKIGKRVLYRVQDLRECLAAGYRGRAA